VRKRLHERGLLATTESKARGELTMRKVLQGLRRKLLHLRADALEADGPTVEGSDEYSRSGLAAEAGEGADMPQAQPDPDRAFLERTLSAFEEECPPPLKRQPRPPEEEPPLRAIDL
jgi:hypothetical protein